MGRKLRRAAACLGAAALLTESGAALAQETSTMGERIERIEAEAELERAKADRAEAEAERVKALGLPSFEGKTELGANAGAMEATLLAADALADAAAMIAAAAPADGVILLAGDEAIDFGFADAMRLEMESIRRLYEIAGIKPQARHTGGRPIGGALPGVVAGISAVAGMLRSETTLSFVETGAVSDKMLVSAVAAHMVEKGREPVLPSELVAGAEGGSDNELFALLNELAALRLAAEPRRQALAGKEKPNGKEKMELANLNAAVTRHDAFVAKATVANDKGVVPIATAARLAGILPSGRQIMRIYVNKAGGSLVNSKNIATFFGVDPLKISGGLVASYRLTDPRQGTIKGADLLSCHTTLTSIRRVQERKWNKQGAQAAHGGSLCQSVLSGKARTFARASGDTGGQARLRYQLTGW